MNTRDCCSTLIIALFTTIFAVGCQQSQQSNADSPIVLKILDIQTNAEGFWETTIPIFEAENPNIHIQHEAVTPDVFNSLRSARLATRDVDLVAGQPQNDLYTESSRSQYLPLTGEGFLTNFYPDLIRQGSYAGVPYIVPTSMDGVVVFYNKDLFADLSLTVPKTWDEFIRTCDAINDNGTPCLLFGGLQQWPVALHIIALETNIVRSKVPSFYDGVASGETSHADPVWVEVFSKLQELSNYYQPFAVGQDHQQVPQMFAQGKGALIISNFPDAGSISKAQPDFEVGVFTLPGSSQAQDNKSISTKIGVGYMIPANSPNIEEAKTWLSFFSRPDIYQIYVEMTGESPSQPNITISDPTMAELVETIEREDYEQLLIWENLAIPGARYDFDPLGIAVVSGQLTPDKAAAQMQSNIMNSRENWELED